VRRVPSDRASSAVRSEVIGKRDCKLIILALA
jgi:hypothetical protein